MSRVTRGDSSPTGLRVRSTRDLTVASTPHQPPPSPRNAGPLFQLSGVGQPASGEAFPSHGWRRQFVLLWTSRQPLPHTHTRTRHVAAALAAVLTLAACSN